MITKVAGENGSCLLATSIACAQLLGNEASTTREAKVGDREWAWIRRPLRAMGHHQIAEIYP